MDYLDGAVLPINGIVEKTMISIHKNDGGIYRGEVHKVERANDDSVIKISVMVGDMFRLMTFYVDEIVEARLTKPVKFAPVRERVPSELHYTDVMGEPNMMKVGNAYNGSGDIVTEITLEQNGMVVVHGEKGIIVVVKSDRIELYYS